MLTSAFGVFSVWINIVRIVPLRTLDWNLSFQFDKSIRGLTCVLEAVKVVDVVR